MPTLPPEAEAPAGPRRVDGRPLAEHHRTNDGDGLGSAVHRSRLFGFFVDAPLAEADRAATFWGAALGAGPRPTDDPAFVTIPGAAGDLAFDVQRVDDAPRYHLDIETDDVAAEVRRLVALGAVEEKVNDGWTVLRAPGGHLFCVVPVQSDRALFDATAKHWG